VIRILLPALLVSCAFIDTRNGGFPDTGDPVYEATVQIPSLGSWSGTVSNSYRYDDVRGPACDTASVLGIQFHQNGWLGLSVGDAEAHTSDPVVGPFGALPVAGSAVPWSGTTRVVASTPMTLHLQIVDFETCYPSDGYCITETAPVDVFVVGRALALRDGFPGSQSPFWLDGDTGERLCTAGPDAWRER